MLAVFIALMIFLIAALDHPFRGEVSVSPASYVTIVKKIMDPLDARAVKLGQMKSVADAAQAAAR